MEIERKFLVPCLPEGYDAHPFHQIEQAYLCTDPVVRIRQEDEDFCLTYKGKGLLSREEYNLPLTSEAYQHLKAKIDGRLIQKTRYMLPLDNGLTIELDLFHGDLEPLILAEVEFPDEETAVSFQAPSWFGEDVTFSSRYHNSILSR